MPATPTSPAHALHACRMVLQVSSTATGEGMNMKQWRALRTLSNALCEWQGATPGATMVARVVALQIQETGAATPPRVQLERAIAMTEFLLTAGV